MVREYSVIKNTCVMHAFVTCLLKIKKNTGVWKPVMQQLLSADNLYSFRYKAFAVTSETGLKVHRIGQYKRVERRNVYTLSRGMYFESMYTQLVFEDESALFWQLSRQTCHCEKCLNMLVQLLAL